MTKLLVSVRSSAELSGLSAASVDILDIKEPRAGSLGRADTATIAQIMRAGSQFTLSVAWGELRQLEDLIWPSTLVAPHFFKVGLAGCRDWPEWRSAWQQLASTLPASTRRVAVAYADAELARSPDWSDVMDAGRSVGADVLLIDTFVKEGQRLIDWWSLDELRAVREMTRRWGWQLAWAGSLTIDDFYALAPLAPDWIAVRSAVCDGDRAGHLSASLVQHAAAVLERAANRSVE